MLFRKAVLFSTLTGAMLISTSASALTAGQLWSEMQSSAQFLGLALQAGTIVDGERQKLYKDVSLNFPFGNGGLSMSEMTLVERDDGSVTVYPGALEVITKAAPPIAVNVDHELLMITVSDSGDGRTYDLSAERIGLQAQASDDAVVNMTYQLSDVSARVSTPETGYLIDTRIGQYLVGTTATYSEIGHKQISQQEGNDLQMLLGVSVPKGLTIADLQTPEAFGEAVRKGLGLFFEGSGADGKLQVEAKGAAQDFSIRYSVGDSKISLVANADTVAVDVSASALSGEVRFPVFPDPVTFSVASIEEGFAMPIVAPNGGSAHIKAKLKDLEISEPAWAMFDPGQVIARGPINLDLDMSTQMKVDLIDQAEKEQLGQPPKVTPEFTAATIKSLFLSFGGATLTGTGDFALKGGFIAPASPPPTPIGTAEFKATGVNQLLENLIALGLIPKDQETGIRFGLAMVAKPGAAPDELVSSIEAKEDGQILINGQRVK